MHKPEYYLTDVALIYQSYCKTKAMCLSFLTNWYLYNQSINPVLPLYQTPIQPSLK